MNNKNITLDELRELCRKFDKEGSYPEHEYEGWSVYEFICNTLNQTDDCQPAPDDWPDRSSSWPE